MSGCKLNPLFAEFCRAPRGLYDFDALQFYPLWQPGLKLIVYIFCYVLRRRIVLPEMADLFQCRIIKLGHGIIEQFPEFVKVHHDSYIIELVTAETGFNLPFVIMLRFFRAVRQNQLM